MNPFDRAYQAFLQILDTLGPDLTERLTEQQRRQLQDIAQALKEDMYQHGFDDGREYNPLNNEDNEP